MNSLNERFQQAYYYLTDTQVVLYSLAANTNYDIVGITLIDGDLTPLTTGTIAPDFANISVADDVTATLAPNALFDFGVRPARIDPLRCLCLDSVDKRHGLTIRVCVPQRRRSCSKSMQTTA